MLLNLRYTFLVLGSLFIVFWQIKKNASNNFNLENSLELACIKEILSASTSSLEETPDISSSPLEKGDKERKNGEKNIVFFTHIVKEGDTLSALAERYNVDVRSIRACNAKLCNSTLIRIGEKLKIPSLRGIPYYVKKGDNLWSISRRYKSSLKSIIEVNQLSSTKKSEYIIKPNQIIFLAGVKWTPPKPKPKPKRRRRKPRFYYVAPSLPKGKKRPRFYYVAPSLSENEDEDIVKIASSYLNKIPYKFGGNSILYGIDCSAFTQLVYRKRGINIPRTAREQFYVGKRIPKEALSPGDLVFFHTYANYPSHVGIYIGENKFIHATSVHKKVTISSLDKGYYAKRYIGAVHISQ